MAAEGLLAQILVDKYMDHMPLHRQLQRFARVGLPQQVFVSKYLINLPSEKELQKIIEEEKEKRL